MKTKIKMTLYVLIVMVVVGATIFTFRDPVVKSELEQELEVQI